MAESKHSSTSRNSAHGGDPLSAEERRLVGMYRNIGSRWEKNAVFLVIQSLAEGRFVPEATDHLSWSQISKLVGLSKEANHG